MKGDIIHVEDYHYEIARRIIQQIQEKLQLHKGIFSISVAGESGSGKSVSAVAIQKELEETGVKCLVLQQDDYFFLPPKSNDLNRRKSLTNVGPIEVDLNWIDANIQEAKNGASFIEKPLVDFQGNTIEKETLSLEGIQVIIVEGTYTSLLKNVDERIFIARDFTSSVLSIKKRARDVVDDFLMQVLQLEHEIISAHQQYCKIIIKEGFDVTFLN